MLNATRHAKDLDLIGHRIILLLPPLRPLRIRIIFPNIIKHCKAATALCRALLNFVSWDFLVMSSQRNITGYWILITISEYILTIIRYWLMQFTK